jgi:parvulin-like peptidyl-prolyl isomerase
MSSWTARQKAREQLETLRAELQSNEMHSSPQSQTHSKFNPGLFGDLARKYSSDTETNTGGGDTSFLTREQFSERYSPEFSSAVFEMRDIGRVAEIVESPKGLHVVELVARQEAISASFDEPHVKETLRANLSQSRSHTSLKKAVAALRAKMPVKIDEKAVAAVKIQQRGSVQPVRSGGRRDERQ